MNETGRHTDRGAEADLSFSIDAPSTPPAPRCPRCGTIGVIVYHDPETAEHWGRCFKCLNFWEIRS